MSFYFVDKRLVGCLVFFVEKRLVGCVVLFCGGEASRVCFFIL